MAEKLAIDGGKPVLTRKDFKNWPIIGGGRARLVNEVLDRGIVAGGTAPQVKALEKEWAAYTGSKYCLTTCSGTAALHMALAAVGVGPGRRGDHLGIHLPRLRLLRDPPERHPRVRRHRSPHLLHGPGEARGGDHPAHQGHHPRPHPGLPRGHGPHPRHREEAQAGRDRGCLPGPRRDVQGQEGRHARRHRHLLAQQLQEPLRRRGRAVHHGQRGVPREGRR